MLKVEAGHTDGVFSGHEISIFVGRAEGDSVLGIHSIKEIGDSEFLVLRPVERSTS